MGINSIMIRIAVLFAAGLAASACVSDTLSQQDTQPQPIAEQKPPTYDPAQREQAIAEIREKAEQPGSGQLTNAYVAADGPAEPLTPQEQDRKINELEKAAQQNNASVSDAELAAKQRSIRELRSQARNHYKDAVNTIKN